MASTSTDAFRVENRGSAARDFCMLERNLLSHIKLALLLSVISSAVLLHVRIVPEETDDIQSKAGVPLAAVQAVGALLAIAAGAWQYFKGSRDLINMTAFLGDPKYHALMTVVVGVVLTTCIILLADESQL